MNYNKYIILFFILFSCTTTTKNNIEVKEVTFKEAFSNKGFTLLYTKKLNDNKIIEKHLDNRSLVIFQKNLKKNTKVKITNLINNKSLLATVAVTSDYPSFYNSVISERIFNKLEIDINEPYVEIVELMENSTFVAKKAKIFDEEKKVAEKAPVDSISINDISIDKKEINKNQKNKNFKYIIKIADFYYKNTAIMMKKRILDETKINKVNISKISSNTFRVYLGPFKDLKSIKKEFNDIFVINFENLEIIKQ